MQPIPQISKEEMDMKLTEARTSARRRAPIILHKPGAEFNEVINFVMHDSYMQPHFHPSAEKIEKIYILEGKMAVLFFNSEGVVEKSIVIEKGKREFIEIPAFAWHTYVALSEYTITYETMMGAYDPKTYKTFASWAPPENDPRVPSYLDNLIKEAIRLESVS